MTRHTVIVGAGPGLSTSIARLAGSAGHDVTLLGRNAQRLRELTANLHDRGVAAEGVSVDVTDHDAYRSALRAIDDARPVDAIVFQPSSPASQLVDVLDATVENVRPNVELLTLGAVATAEVLARRMVTRGSGALVFVGGGSSQLPLRAFGNLGVTMAGVRGFARTLDRALRGTGVHSGYLTLAGMVAAPDAQELGEHEVDVEVVAAAAWALVQGEGSHDVMVSPERPGATEGS